VTDDPKQPPDDERKTEDEDSPWGLPEPQAPEPSGPDRGTAAIFAAPSAAAVFDAAQASLREAQKQVTATHRPPPLPPEAPPIDEASLEFDIPAGKPKAPPAPPPPPPAKGQPPPVVKIKARGGMLGQIMVENGLLTAQQRDMVLAIQAQPGNTQRFGEIAIAKGFVNRQALEAALKAQQRHVSDVHKEQSQVIPLPKELVEPDADEKRDVARMLTWLNSALRHNASDLHLMSGKALVLRHNGRLTKAKGAPIAPEEAEQFLRSLLDDREKATLEAHSSITKCIDLPGRARARACIFRHTGGLNGAFRLIPSSVPSLVELNLPSAIGKFTTYSQGLVLVTGPISSGKTTTLATLIDIINQERYDHIIAIEQPIEFFHHSRCSLVTQRQVGAHTSSFANALRASLREDPDVIVVGEMHDLETAQLAVTAAETGHLVFATLHTQNAVRSINRVLDMFPAEEARQIRTVLAENLRGVISQQLVPRADVPGRVPVVELLFVTPAIRNLIREEKVHQLKNAIQISRNIGNLTAEDHAAQLLERKLIDEQTYQRVCDERG
jgi:twitching motility protein PilT